MIQLDMLANEGNFKHNVGVLKGEKGFLVVARREKGAEHNASEYLPCEYCKKFILRRSLWAHHRKCSILQSDKESDMGMKSNAVRRGRNLLNSALMTDPDPHVVTLLSRMQDDHIKEIVSKDELIKRYAALRVESLGCKSDQKINDIHRVSQGARTLARLVAAVQEKNPSQRLSLNSLVRPENFDKVLEATKGMCIGKPESATSLGRLIGNLLGHVVQIKIGSALRDNNSNACQEGKHFQKLLEAEWNYRVNAVCVKRMNSKKRQEIKTIPLTEDLQRLRTYTTSKMEEMSASLKLTKDPAAWTQLAKLTMCRLIMFNKRRRAEVKDLKVADYLSRPDWTDHQNGEFDLALSASSRMLAKR